MPAIEVHGLTKAFRTYKKIPGFLGAIRGLWSRAYTATLAANDVCFSIHEGELVGFLGPNGAGKTTVLKMLSGLLYPTRGTATVLGYIPWERENAYRRQFALVMGQKNQLWWDLPAHESFELNREIYGIERKTFQKKLDELVDLLEMREKLNVMVRELSLGERMKMELIAALLHSPRVLFLDEPTIGLDVISQQKVRQFIREYNERHRVTILLTSHYMADIEALCDRVIIIHQGNIFFDGRLSEIVNRFADSKLIHFQCSDEPSTSAMERFGSVLENISGHVRLKVQRANVLKVCKQLLEEVPITDLNIEEIPIDDVIREIFSQQSALGSRKLAEQRAQSAPRKAGG